ncbi:transcriptional regulator [Serratia quinivorans]|uniref:winged helix-turn-helix domain-containing protein n=1 Tax=Serratia quinivorans TaxID=137545 RepID=UPI00217A53AF|nr:winged helix-turn-helix domain-containing protein [Serratia quinivorans]CAI0696568.1 DNA-binding transcriptional activator CadC [Serratia quinivorans]
MKYIINLIIIYDPEQRSLLLNNSPLTAIELSKPSCRVFNELIKRNGADLSRDELLKNAWEDFGFPSSNASLNNCISEIRKAFVSLGMEEKIIITMPKVGFRLDANIQTIAESGNKDEPVRQPEQVEQQSSPVSPAYSELEKPEPRQENFEQLSAPAELSNNLPLIAKIQKVKTSHKIKLLLPILPLLLIPILMLTTGPGKRATVMSLYNDDECKISTLGPDKGTQNMLSRAKAKIASLNIDCENEKHDIFYIEERSGENVKNRAFLAVCDRLNNDEYSSCKNYKDNLANIK